jgi:hypothetical protein
MRLNQRGGMAPVEPVEPADPLDPDGLVGLCAEALAPF